MNPNMTTEMDCYKTWLSKQELWLCNVNTLKGTSYSVVRLSKDRCDISRGVPLCLFLTIGARKTCAKSSKRRYKVQIVLTDFHI